MSGNGSTLDDEVYTLFASAARAQKRSIANLIQTVALAKVFETKRRELRLIVVSELAQN